MLSLKKLKNSIQSFIPANWWGETWREGFFSGNGQIGINAFGGALNEKILINLAELNWQGKVSVMPDIGAKIKEVRQLIDEGNTEEAQTVMSKLLVQKNFRPQTFYPLPLAVLNIFANTDKTPKEFHRVLNTSNGEISISYLDANTRMTRNMFVSRADGLIVCELVKTGQKLIDVDLSFSVPDKINARTPVGVSMTPEGVLTKCEGNFLYFSARNDDGSEFGVVAKVTYYGGTIVPKDDKLNVRGANSVLIVAKPFANSYKEKEFNAIKTQLASNKATYDKLLKAHQAIHQKEMDGLEIEIESSSLSDTAENLLLDCKKEGVMSPALAKKMWNFGRYLLYSSTAFDGKIVLPTGLFNGNYKSVENTVNFAGKTESCYHAVLAGGMEQLLEPLFVFAENAIGDMRDNAIRLFGVRGLFLPAVTTGVTGRVGLVEPSVLHFTGCAGYLAGLFYDYYLFTKDTKFLKTRALPFMKEVAQFYEEFFKLTREDVYESSPGYSPMSTQSDAKQPTYIGKNATIDFSIATQLLQNLIEGANVANVYKDEVDKWQDMLTKIPSPKVDSDGALRDYADKNADFKTAGVGALYSAFASRNVDMTSDDETLKTYVATARKKLAESGNYQTAMTMIDLARAFIRLGQKAQAMECLSNVVNCCAYNNLALGYSDWRGNGVVGENVWAPMQLSANMAFATAIQEMLLYSKEGALSILPCIPNDWKNITVENMQAVGNLAVSIELSAKGLLNVSVKAKKTATFDLYLPENVKKLKKSNVSCVLDTEPCPRIKNVTVSAGKTATFSFVYSF